ERNRLPLITCNMGTAILARRPFDKGMSELALSRVSRVAGADGVYSGILGSDWYSDEVERMVMAALKNKYHNFKSCAPVVAGGLTVVNLWQNLKHYGDDVLLQAGTGLLGYPGGVAKGVRAMRKIIDEVPRALTSAEANDATIRLASKYGYLRDGL